MAWVRITFIKILLLFLLPCVLLRFEVSSTLWWKTTIGKTTLQRKEFIYYQEQDFLGNKHCLNPRHWQFYQLFWLIHSTYNLREFLSGQQRSWAYKIFVNIKFTICVYNLCIESKAYPVWCLHLLEPITYMSYFLFQNSASLTDSGISESGDNECEEALLSKLRSLAQDLQQQLTPKSNIIQEITQVRNKISFMYLCVFDYRYAVWNML